MLALGRGLSPDQRRLGGCCGSSPRRGSDRLDVEPGVNGVGDGPLAVFNPDLHMPKERNTANMAHLEQKMRDAEASHFILLVLTLGVVVHAAVRGWWGVAAWTMLFDVLVNGYPVMLQRYNRARLRRRFGR